jgi:NAD(P)-dependent dehydrogenase (short-subunit alcohol dehydrogenase family)
MATDVRELHGLRALVTGGTKGIDHAVAGRLCGTVRSTGPVQTRKLDEARRSEARSKGGEQMAPRISLLAHGVIPVPCSAC